MTGKNLTIGVFAGRAGVNVETIRYYQRRGLLSEPPKPLGGVRRYHEADVHRVVFIKAAQGLGFTLEEVGELLKLEDGEHCVQARSLAERKLTDVRARLATLRSIESVLADLVDKCRGRRGNISCPLIATLHDAKHLNYVRHRKNRINNIRYIK